MENSLQCEGIGGSLTIVRFDDSPMTQSLPFPSYPHRLEDAVFSPRAQQSEYRGARMYYAKITGWGKCLPPAVLSNADLATFMDTLR
jgi:hypothetical protein